MKRIMLLVLVVFLAGCKAEITNFEECAAAGYLIMESYPQQCSDGTNTFTEVIEMDISEALEIAADSECTEKGVLTENSFYNENTNTWWIDLDMKEEFENELCSPACVINAVTLTAEINWRCTGAIE